MSKPDYENEILKLITIKPRTLTQCAEELRTSKSTAHKYIHSLEEQGKIEFAYRIGNNKYYSVVSFVNNFLDMMKEYPTVAIAPFCPVITGAYVVLRDGVALVLPLNSYVCIGLEKFETRDKGGEVNLIIEESTERKILGARGRIDRQELFDDVADATVKTVCDVAKIDKLGYDFNVKLYSDLSIARGCGGSGAIAASTVLALLASLGKIVQLGPLSENSKGYRLAINSAYRLEQIIHGKGRLKTKYYSPFSSGASPLCAFHGSTKGRLLSYRLLNWKDLRDDPNKYPKEDIRVVTKKSLPPLLLIVGSPKSTKDCFRHIESVQQRLGREIDFMFFEFWKRLSEDIVDSFRLMEKEADTQKEREQNRARAITEGGELLKIQNGLYCSLGLDDKDFTDLIRTTPEKCAGGSVIGGGMGGTCLLIYHDLKKIKDERKRTQALERLRETIQQRISPYCEILPENTLTSSHPAQVLRI